MPARRSVPATVTVPTGFAVFANEFVPEGSRAARVGRAHVRVRRWTEMPRGGHFAALEEPELLARDIGAFFGALTSRVGTAASEAVDRIGRAFEGDLSRASLLRHCSQLSTDAAPPWRGGVAARQTPGANRSGRQAIATTSKPMLLPGTSSERVDQRSAHARFRQVIARARTSSSVTTAGRPQQASRGCSPRRSLVHGTGSGSGASARRLPRRCLAMVLAGVGGALPSRPGRRLRAAPFRQRRTHAEGGRRRRTSARPPLGGTPRRPPAPLRARADQ